MTAPDTPERRALAPRDVIAMAIVVTIWTGFVLVSRFGVKVSLLPTDLMALRFGVSGAVMLPLLVSRWHAGGWARVGGGLRPWQWLAIALSAGVGFGAFVFAGFARAPAAHGAVLMTGTLPVWTALIAWGATGERPSPARAVGLTIIAVGIAALGVHTFSLDASDAAHSSGRGATWIGDVCFVAAAISWAVFLLIARRWNARPVETTIAIACGSALLYLPVYVAMLPKRLDAAPLAQVAFIGAWQGLLSVVLNVLLYTRVIASIGAVRTAMLTAAVPGLAAVLAVPLLGEPLTVSVVVGLVLVTVGMVTGLRPSAPVAQARS